MQEVLLGIISVERLISIQQHSDGEHAGVITGRAPLPSSTDSRSTGIASQTTRSACSHSATRYVSLRTSYDNSFFASTEGSPDSFRHRSCRE